MIKLPVIVNWLVVPLRVRLPQWIPRIKSPSNTGQLGAEGGIVTSVVLPGARKLSQFDRIFHSEEVFPDHKPEIPARMYPVFIVVSLKQLLAATSVIE